MVGIKVVRENGQPFDFGQALLREFVIKNLLVGVVGGFFVVGPLINYLWPLWDDQNRCLHDLMVDSRVILA
jgi:uncharacterized RDD family membrane protein YckC